MKILNFESFKAIDSLNESSVFTDFDKNWDYKKDGEKWFAKKKGANNWVDISSRQEAVKKLNAKYFPDSKSPKKTEQPAPKKESPVKKPVLKIDTSFTSNKMDTFDPYKVQSDIKKKQADKVIEEIKGATDQFLKKEAVETPDGLTTKIPAHMRAYLNFLGLRKEPFTSKDLTKSELLSIKNMIELKKSQKKFSSGQNFDFYNASNEFVKSKGGSETINFGDKNLGFDQTDVKEDSTKIALTLGNAKVTENPNSYVIEDIYDFNNFQKNPEKYTLKTLPKTVAGAMVKIFSNNYVQGLEELSSVIQKFGYKGYPVRIEIPKGSPSKKA